MDLGLQQRAALARELVAEVVASFSEARLKVTGASMIPAIWPGDVITVRRDAAVELRPGQIVLYRREGELVAHRVVHIDNGSFITRGDALLQDDPPVRESDMVGLVTGIVRNGRSAHVSQSQWGRAFSSMLRRSDFCLRMALRWHNCLRRIAWTE